MESKYIKNSKISEAKIREIIRYFSLDITATLASKMIGVSRQTINKHYDRFRKLILLESLDAENIKKTGEFELDESYFGAKRVRGKRGRGAGRKTPVFGLLKREGKVQISVVKNCSKEQLLPIIKGEILEGSTIHTDGWPAYDSLIANGYNHYRVFHSHDEFVRGKSHVNGIESFWSYCKRRLSKFNGIKEDKFLLHIKECEYRFNNRGDEKIYKNLLKLVRQNLNLLV